MDNTLADVLNKIFKNSEKYDIKFKVSSILDGSSPIDAETVAPDDPANYKGEFFKQTIRLNKDVLTNATKEYILVTLYHEVVHAYLNYELNRLGQARFEMGYPALAVYKTEVKYDELGKQFKIGVFVFKEDHSEAGYYIDTLEKIIKDYNPNILQNTARIMAKAGMVTLTDDEKKINFRERGIDKTLGQQEGSKCSN